MEDNLTEYFLCHFKFIQQGKFFLSIIEACFKEAQGFFLSRFSHLNPLTLTQFSHFKCLTLSNNQILQRHLQRRPLPSCLSHDSRGCAAYLPYRCCGWLLSSSSFILPSLPDCYWCARLGWEKGSGKVPI